MFAASKRGHVNITASSIYSLVLEDLQATDQPLQTQQVIAVCRYIDLVQDDVRRSRCLGVTLLSADYLLL